MPGAPTSSALAAEEFALTGRRYASPWAADAVQAQAAPEASSPSSCSTGRKFQRAASDLTSPASDLRRSGSLRTSAVSRLVDLVHIPQQAESEDAKAIKALCTRLVDAAAYRVAAEELGVLPELEALQQVGHPPWPRMRARASLPRSRCGSSAFPSQQTQGADA